MDYEAALKGPKVRTNVLCVSGNKRMSVPAAWHDAVKALNRDCGLPTNEIWGYFKTLADGATVAQNTNLIFLEAMENDVLGPPGPESTLFKPPTTEQAAAREHLTDQWLEMAHMVVSGEVILWRASLKKSGQWREIKELHDFLLQVSA